MAHWRTEELEDWNGECGRKEARSADLELCERWKEGTDGGDDDGDDDDIRA